MQNKPKPFGMLFEEQVTSPHFDNLIPQYDPSESISFVVDHLGHRVPYVEADWRMLGTSTYTKANAETTDEDPDRPRPKTQTMTVTEVKKETTDKD